MLNVCIHIGISLWIMLSVKTRQNILGPIIVNVLPVVDGWSGVNEGMG